MSKEYLKESVEFRRGLVEEFPVRQEITGALIVM